MNIFELKWNHLILVKENLKQFNSKREIDFFPSNTEKIPLQEREREREETQKMEESEQKIGHQICLLSTKVRYVTKVNELKFSC